VHREISTFLPHLRCSGGNSKESGNFFPGFENFSIFRRALVHTDWGIKMNTLLPEIVAPLYHIFDT
jgi:hypothetical protein